MWTQSFGKFGNLVVRGLVRWLELLGQNPPLSRDHGIYAWRYLQVQPQAGLPQGETGRTGRGNELIGDAGAGRSRPGLVQPGAIAHALSRPSIPPQLHA